MAVSYTTKVKEKQPKIEVELWLSGKWRKEVSYNEENIRQKKGT